jgi:ABC-type molybdate transport system ATPase subunit
MGASGSGKTSLLNALAGQVPQSASIELRGSVLVNGAPATEQNHK